VGAGVLGSIAKKGIKKEKESCSPQQAGRRGAAE